MLSRDKLKFAKIYQKSPLISPELGDRIHPCSNCIPGIGNKQGLVQDYTQQIEGANISGLKLSRSPGFENFNYNNALLNYNNDLRLENFKF